MNELNLFVFSVNYMGITYALLAQGSAFWHGSQTRGVGLPADTKLNDLFAFVAYQAAVENLGPRDNSIIHDLSPTPRWVSILITYSYLVALIFKRSYIDILFQR